jgi:hypothetical protein
MQHYNEWDHLEVVEALGAQEGQEAWDQQDPEEDHKGLSSQWYQQEMLRPWDSYHKCLWEIEIKWITSLRKLKDTYILIKT